MSSPDGVEREQYARQLVSAGVQANLALSADVALHSLDRQPTSVLNAATTAAYDEFIRAELLKAGTSLLGGLEEFAHDDALWQSFAGGTVQAEHRTALLKHELHIREILSHNIPSMLLNLGYPKPPPPPPPPVNHWVTWMQGPLDRLFTGSLDDWHSSTRVAEARRRLSFFINRFRNVLDKFGNEVALVDAPELPVQRGRRILAAAVKAGRNRAIPAAIAAAAAAAVVGGATLAIAPPAAPATAFATLVGVVGADAAKELVKAVTEAAALEGVSGQPNELPAMTITERVREAAGMLDVALDRLGNSDVRDQWEFIATSQVFNLLRELSDDYSHMYYSNPLLGVAESIKGGDSEMARHIWYDIRHDLYHRHPS